ncbi:DNA polymerase III subunit gamma/tau [Paenibacillus dauci]|uniref:DNA polymerase III subunit gamma/tau n=1 Tax=Paenibacillus dauci TaxID=1567106 RepID=UPI000619F567|nr:DNA polymerase III subunit gamma/tau [Paenibacillus dauci]
MEHIALYRAWRPQSFQDMVGQQHIIQTLQNAIREERISHAYLFNGPRGTGKTSAAKILAKAINCEKGPAIEPCNECETCKRITSGNIMDVLEIDAASNRGVEEIRDLREKVKYAPTEVRRKVYIIDEVHMLTTEAFNALLKTLEEPPGHVVFILATTEPHRLPATIISRCQRFDFRRVSLQEQTERLQLISEQEGLESERDALEYIARLSDGGMRDALSILDQVSSFTEGKITYPQVLQMTGGIASEQFAELASALLQNDVGKVLHMVESFMQEGKSAEKCMENLLYYFRDVLMIKMIPQAGDLTERMLNPENFRETAAAFTKEQLFAMIDTLNHYQTEMKYATQPQMLFEVALLKLSSIPGGNASENSAGVVTTSGGSADAGEIRQLKQQLAALEQKLDQALKSGISTGGEAASSNTGRRAPAPRISAAAKIPSQMPHYVSNRNHEDFAKISGSWSKVLQRVKEVKVTIHAWFVNCDPVSFHEDAVLVAFKHDMHRETIEKSANKQVIESVLNEILGGSYRLVTMMQKDWMDAIEGTSEQPGEELKLEHEEAANSDALVDEAIQLFGEELVVIKE